VAILRSSKVVVAGKIPRGIEDCVEGFGLELWMLAGWAEYPNSTRKRIALLILDLFGRESFDELFIKRWSKPNFL
jgi:hypothetical protein